MGSQNGAEELNLTLKNGLRMNINISPDGLKEQTETLEYGAKTPVKRSENSPLVLVNTRKTLPKELNNARKDAKTTGAKPIVASLSEKKKTLNSLSELLI